MRSADAPCTEVARCSVPIPMCMCRQGMLLHVEKCLLGENSIVLCHMLVQCICQGPNSLYPMQVCHHKGWSRHCKG